MFVPLDYAQFIFTEFNWKLGYKLIMATLWIVVSLLIHNLIDNAFAHTVSWPRKESSQALYIFNAHQGGSSTQLSTSAKRGRISPGTWPDPRPSCQGACNRAAQENLKRGGGYKWEGFQCEWAVLVGVNRILTWDDEWDNERARLWVSLLPLQELLVSGNRSRINQNIKIICAWSRNN